MLQAKLLLVRAHSAHIPKVRPSQRYPEHQRYQPADQRHGPAPYVKPRKTDNAPSHGHRTEQGKT